VFREYAEQSYRYLLQRVRPEMDAADFIDTLVRSSYAFSVEHEDIFSFIEQCSRCPTLASQVCEEECSGGVLEMIHSFQTENRMCTCSDRNMWSLLFAPVRFLALNRTSAKEDAETLDELVTMLQNLLLR
jgi:NAD-dependent dihydropyrimidine dehydrogenase PreA subunit